ncbi:beta-ketoacyl-[acyl-carrier-protein] synthase family protein [Coralloluteibacterium thermophilus]|uniref:beta-ketoacyl-[acyl-carrier-protein] synthase family protein n=1 Tax=Coralloluteibacterium thermophilum TaxID=2707049 RepID=UPI00366F99FB
MGSSFSPAIAAHTATSALGAGRDAHRRALLENRSGLRPNDFPHAPLACWIGRVEGVEAVALPPALADWSCRNNRLAWLGLQQDGFLDAVAAVRERVGARRVATVMGTSTSSIGETEQAYRELDADGRFPEALARPIVHTPHSIGDFVQRALALEGPAITVATACSSSAKVFAQAARLIRAGVVDAAVVGGVDTLCGSVLYGFNSLELVSSEPCRPFDAERRGLSLGEAAGYALLVRPDLADAPLRLAGCGESSDAHHMSSPHPEGLGAELAMREALQAAGIAPADVGYINCHGTATPANDRVEAAVVARMFPESVHASSTKGWTGHTLGAAGALEAVVALLALEHGELPGTLNARTLDAACGPQIRTGAARAQVGYALSTSFGFGGNNCALVFGHA